MTGYSGTGAISTKILCGAGFFDSGRQGTKSVEAFIMLDCIAGLIGNYQCTQQLIKGKLILPEIITHIFT
jgi:hypothetical protein